MAHTVKHAEVVKDSTVTAVYVYVVYEPSSVTAPFSVLVVLVLCLLEPHSARFTIILLFLGHCSFSSCWMFLLVCPRSLAILSHFYFCQCLWGVQREVWLLKNHSICNL